MAMCEEPAENETKSSKVLFPGQQILYEATRTYAAFSGKLSCFGLTVGHIAKVETVGSGKAVELHDADDEKQVIAEIVKRIEGTIKTEDDEFTADISFLKMTCMVQTTLRCSNRSTGRAVGEYVLVLHKEGISDEEPVMVLDNEGFMKQGRITMSRFNCKPNGDGVEVINALFIVDEEKRAIAAHGQSGTLVTSCPQPGSAVLRVYGIVTHIHRDRDTSTSATIANRLWDVLKAYHNSRDGQTIGLRLGETLESIDFIED